MKRFVYLVSLGTFVACGSISGGKDGGGGSGAAGSGQAGAAGGSSGSGSGGAGTTGSAGRGGTTGGTGGHVCGPEASCTRCATGACCGTSCCASGEWCDTSGATPLCRCGTTGACTGGNMCTSGGPAQIGGSSGSDACGAICCGVTPPGCPVSRRIYKRDIEPLDAEALARIYEQLRQIQLTTYQYKSDPAKTPRHLGFIIDDTKTPYPVNPDGISVDLYGYMSMAVAAIQVQSREIETLRAEVARLRHRNHDADR